MGESIAFLTSVVAIVYVMYWFWKNDDGLGTWGRKKPFDPQNRDEDEMPR